MLHTHREIERAAIERVSSGFKAGLIAKDSLINAVERKARYAFVIFLSSHNSIRVIFLALDFSNRAPLCFLFFSAPFVAIDNPSRKRRAIISVEQQRALVSAAMLRFSRESIFPRSIPWKSAMFARLLFAEKSWRGAPRCLGRRRLGRPSARTDWTRPPSENTSGPSKIGWERKTWGPVTWSDGLTVRAYLLF